MRSIARLRAVAISQPAGLAGPPSRGLRFRGDRECLLGRVHGQFDVAEESDQRREHPVPLVAEDGVKRH
jgi:hypothetical protein